MTGQNIANELRQNILSGSLKPGEELRQTEIAQEFNVSRIPVRDALGILASENLVVLNPNRKAKVIALTQTELSEIFDLRILLECNALSLAIENITPDILDHVTYILEKSNIEAGRPGWTAGDWAFHKALYQPSGLSKHIQIIEELRQTCQIHVAAYGELKNSTDQWLKDHKIIVRLYQKGDVPGAKNTLAAHLTAAKKSLLHGMAD